MAAPVSAGSRPLSSSAAATSSEDEKDGSDGAAPATDHFSALGLPRTFDLPESELRAAYRSLISRLHPDRHWDKDDKERQRIEGEASSVTRARDVLSSAMTRAEHLLELEGLGLEGAAGVELVGPELLMEVMEIREAVDEAETDKVLGALLDENRGRVDETCADLKAAFGAGDLNEARRLTAQLRYWGRIDEIIVEKMSVVK